MMAMFLHASGQTPVDLAIRMEQATACPATASAEPGLSECAPHPPAVAPAAPGSARQLWHGEVGTPQRLAMASSIIRVLRARGLQSSLGPKFADAVRLLELMLYRTAPSKDAYLDAATLDARIVGAVQQRRTAALARRAQLQPAPATVPQPPLVATADVA